MNNRPYSADKTAQLNQPCAEYRAEVGAAGVRNGKAGQVKALRKILGLSESVSGDVACPTAAEGSHAELFRKMLGFPGARPGDVPLPEAARADAFRRLILGLSE
jgi:hypothetical protein